MSAELEKYFQEPSVDASKADVTDHPEAYGIVIRTPDLNWHTAVRLMPREFDFPEFWNPLIYKIQTLIYHRIKYPEIIFKKQSEFLDFINQNYPDRTPEEKIECLLDYIHDLTHYDGQKIDLLYDKLDAEQLDKKLFFRNMEELKFYIGVLLKLGYIDCNSEAQFGYTGISFTIEGIAKIIHQKEIKNSRFCFVAMSFRPELEYLYNDAIKPAIIETGFIPYILSQEFIESDITINDAILAGIKKSQFTISDFTQHKNGVYFEAGYALGRGKKVIYTCAESEWAGAHFDTNHYQHILWIDAQDLKQKLIDRIEAFIKD